MRQAPSISHSSGIMSFDLMALVGVTVNCPCSRGFSICTVNICNLGKVGLKNLSMEISILVFMLLKNSGVPVTDFS